ncbi:MAG: hypothetical protein U1F67_20410 [Rubrivivax sp.]
MQAIARTADINWPSPILPVRALCSRIAAGDRAAAQALSRWTLAFAGAEIIRPQTLERFAAAFSGSGFDRRAFYPLLWPGRVHTPGDRQPAQRAGAAVCAELLGAARGRAAAAPGFGIRIVDPDTGVSCEEGKNG